MKILFTTALIIAAVTSLVHAQEELRLSPSDINALTTVNAGAGTSGVSGIQTRTLKGDATTSRVYTIQLTIPAKPNDDSLFANVNGVRIHYLKSGSGKTPLVLIHGFGDAARMWLPLFADFGKDYTIIAPDLRGLGQSSRDKTGYNN